MEPKVNKKRIAKILKRAVDEIKPEDLPLFAPRTNTIKIPDHRVETVIKEIEKVQPIVLPITPIEKRKEEIRIKKESVPKEPLSELKQMIKPVEKKAEASALFRELERDNTKITS